MKKLAVVPLFAACLAAAPCAETHLSGDVKTATLDSTGNPYIVDQDIVVPAGKKLAIKEGCVLLFKGFTGLNVVGQLHVAGSARRPVVFTSVNDGDYNPKSDQLPNPFDWNGVLVAKESGGALFENFQLRYSVYGIKSQATTVSIQNGIFRQNGQFHFTINDKIQYVQDNIAYSYTPTSSESEKPGVIGSGGEAGGAPAKPQAAKPGKGKLIFRYTSLGVGVVGIAAGSILLILWNNAKTNVYALLNNPSSYSDPNAKYNQLTGQVGGYGAGSVISYTLGVPGLVGFGVSFAF